MLLTVFLLCRIVVSRDIPHKDIRSYFIHVYHKSIQFWCMLNWTKLFKIN